ncbi:MAG TPA: Fur family transcriptional regulator [Methylophilaceae bacterium]|jgi:Fur family ferric uptake transcriptional regulator
MMSATEIIQEAGLRPTANRIAVLEALLRSPHPLTHQELLDTLSISHDFDRVTLYRILDWLLSNGIVHKIAGDSRAWRFQLNATGAGHRHAHFECSACGRIYCLDEVSPRTPKLPKGFLAESISLNIKGRCASCTPA